MALPEGYDKRGIRRCFLLLALLAGFLTGLNPSLAHAAQPLPGFGEVRSAYLPSDGLLLDRHGEVLADVRFDFTSRRADWVPLSALPRPMRDALLVAEDKRFFEHGGVDWLAVMGAAWQNIWTRTRRGASTLTMQLAGLLDPALRMPSAPGARRSVAQKWDQGLAAVELEKRWHKPEIFEAYLNLAPFRGDLQGIGAASEMLFGQPATSLGYKEACILAALLRGPNARPALVAKRACALANRLGQGKLCNEISRLALSRLDQPRGARFKLAPHLGHQLVKYAGQRVGTTLDAGLQRKLLGALQNSWHNQESAAILLDNATGDVLAWIGGVTPSIADGVLVRRKLPEWSWPYLAAWVLEQRQFTAASPLPDSLAVLDAQDERVPLEWSSLRNALSSQQAGSLHYLQSAAGRTVLAERLRMLGVEPGEQANGLNELNLSQLAAAWRALATGGHFVPPRLKSSDNGGRSVLRPESAFIVLDMLGQATPGSWSALWPMSGARPGEIVLVGSTDRFTVALSGQAPANLSGSWQNLLRTLGGERAHAPNPPEGVVQSEVSFDPPNEPPRREWFLRGTEHPGTVTYLSGRRARIIAPQADSMREMTGDENEHWVLQAEAGVPVRWRLDGRVLGEGAHVDWVPHAGRHSLSLLGLNEELLDSIEFEVEKGSDSTEQKDEER